MLIMFKKTITVGVICTLMAGGTYASVKPTPGKGDRRLRHVVYDPENVTQVHTRYGWTTRIVFGDGEIVKYVSIADREAWSAFPVPNSPHLILMPVAQDAGTNMSVFTNKRVYDFDLYAKKKRGRSRESMVYKIKFDYPQERRNNRLAKKRELERRAIEKKKKHIDMAKVNRSYTRKGSDILSPVEVFDDNKFTYFRFNEKIAVPAIYVVNADKTETMINFHKREDGLYTVQRIAGQFALRSNRTLTCIYNNAFSDLFESKVPIDLRETKVKDRSTDLSYDDYNG